MGGHPHVQVDRLRCLQPRVLDAVGHYLGEHEAAPREQVAVDLWAQVLERSSRRGGRVPKSEAGMIDDRNGARRVARGRCLARSIAVLAGPLGPEPKVGRLSSVAHLPF